MMYLDFKNEVRTVLKDREFSILSDDLDGYISSSIAQKYLGLKVAGFFNPYSFYTIKDVDKNKTVGLDVTFDKKRMDIPTISNHVERFSDNKKVSLGVSCNEHINVNNYTDKSLFSTSLLLWSSLNLPLPETRKGKMLLLSLDVTYKQYYAGDGAFRDKLRGYLKAYGLEELMYLLENTSHEEFKDLTQEYKLYRDVEIAPDGKSIDEEKLYADGVVDMLLKELDLERLELPKKFDFQYVLDRRFTKTNLYPMIREKENVFSFAITSRNNTNYSVLKSVKPLQ